MAPASAIGYLSLTRGLREPCPPLAIERERAHMGTERRVGETAGGAGRLRKIIHIDMDDFYALVAVYTRGLSAIVLPDSRRLPSNIEVSATGTSSSQLPRRHFEYRCLCNSLRQPPARGSRQSASKNLPSRLSASRSCQYGYGVLGIQCSSAGFSPEAPRWGSPKKPAATAAGSTLLPSGLPPEL